MTLQEREDTGQGDKKEWMDGIWGVKDGCMNKAKAVMFEILQVCTDNFVTIIFSGDLPLNNS